MKIAVCPDGTKLAFDDSVTDAEMKAAVRRYVALTQPAQIGNVNPMNQPVMVQLPDINIPEIKLPDINFPAIEIPPINMPTIHLPEVSVQYLEEIAGNILGLQGDVQKLTIEMHKLAKSVDNNSQNLNMSLKQNTATMVKAIQSCANEVCKVGTGIVTALSAKKVIRTDSNGNPTGVEIQ